MAVRCQLARDFGWSPGARAIDEPLCPLAGKAMDPLTQRGRGKPARVRDSVQTLAVHDVAHGLGTAENTGFFGLRSEGISGRKGVLGKVPFAGLQAGSLHTKVLRKISTSSVILRTAPLIGTPPFRLKFSGSC
jgi:hypothetical protein